MKGDSCTMCLTALRAGVDLDTAATTRGLLHPNDAWRLRVAGEMADALARDASRDWRPSARIAAGCAPFALDGSVRPLPTYPVPERYPDDDSYLRARVYEGARRRDGATVH